MYFLYLKILCLILLLLNLLKKTRKKVAFWINRRNGLRKERIKKRKKNEKGKEKHEAHGCATPIQITIRATSISRPSYRGPPSTHGPTIVRGPFSKAHYQRLELRPRPHPCSHFDEPRLGFG